MTPLDEDTQEAIDALVYRIRDRGEADLEIVAREFMLQLRERHGWRPTEARRIPWKVPPGDSGLPDPDRPGGAEYTRIRAQLEDRKPDPHIRAVGMVADTAGYQLTVGVDYDTVTVGLARLDSYQASEFAALYVSACIEAARQAGALSDAARAELRAAAAEMGLAEVGGNVHDQAYSNHEERNEP